MRSRVGEAPTDGDWKFRVAAACGSRQHGGGNEANTRDVAEECGRHESVAVAVEKFLAFLVPANESVELLCLELFANGDYKRCLFRAK